MLLVERKTLEAPVEQLLPLPNNVVFLSKEEDTVEARAAILSALEDLNVEEMSSLENMRAECIHGLTDSDCRELENISVLQIG